MIIIKAKLLAPAYGISNFKRKEANFLTVKLYD